jgi:hypothetical protein
MARSMQGTFEQSQKALDASIRGLRLDQRAYMPFAGIDLISVDAQSSPAYIGQNPTSSIITEWAMAKPFRARVIIKNIGKSPSRRHYGYAQMGFADIPTRTELLKAGDETFRTAQGEISKLGDVTQDVAPNQEVMLLGFPPKFLGGIAVQNVKRGDAAVVVAGIVKYWDIFDTPHQTEFCVVYMSDTPASYTYCADHNTIN